jgi:hypothetical protein
LLDGQAVPGSLTRLSTGNDDAPSTVLTGVTDGSVIAGSHTLDFGAKCANGNIPTGALHDFYSTGTAVVLG